MNLVKRDQVGLASVLGSALRISSTVYFAAAPHVLKAWHLAAVRIGVKGEMAVLIDSM